VVDSTLCGTRLTTDMNTGRLWTFGKNMLLISTGVQYSKLQTLLLGQITVVNEKLQHTNSQ